jgi:hypothetical protein
MADQGYGQTGARDWLNRHQAAGTTTAGALAFFDSLPIVPLDAMMGRWRGSGLGTGHAMDGLLESFGWWGKSFTSPDHVDPLLVVDRAGTITAINSRFIPSALLPHLRAGGLAASIIETLLPVGRVLLHTTAPTARLRLMEHRGRVSATMIYDFLPIHDVFRQVDDATRLGLMDMRGMDQPFFFVLRRA